MTTRTLLVAACFLIGGCSTLTDYGVVRKDALRNDQGYVIGYKEMLRNEQTGEVMVQVALYTPMLGDNGEVVGYEEQSKDGAIIRNVDGRPIGARFSDLRSRGTNARNKGLTIVFRPADVQKVALSQPKLWEMMASLSPSDLRRIQ